ncbi:ABC transporter ATP-binding protein [Streptomyces daghestanicus]|uniref:ABC transporter ATP-binding protein n=1 Tax=Streptomyces daghestanicus TaxID=66885 RepID=A0ABQ3Q085_9ACTN|nr:ATP-binding cassette domain-containing protein [Streptomyces daghestanicus]GGU38457.1 ABC transporter ATP-binding protein [Streptomyces daghestanicus]GHI30681.1 ABC transporter ATP-binding protein [Streptomyces daghestanicus]
MVAPPDNDVLRASALHFQHHDGSPALQGVSLGVREGEVLAVTGPRGSGKTSLLRCLAGLDRPQRGEVWFDGVAVHTLGALARARLRRHRFGWIDPVPVLVPELTVWENAALPLMLRGTGRRRARRAALEWLERLDVDGRARSRPHELRHSERQRVCIARALTVVPSVLFADEPTAPLHRAESAQVLRTLTAAARSHGVTVVLACAGPRRAGLADRTVTLLDGRRVRTLHLPPVAGPAGPAEGAEPAGSAGTEGRPACSLSA